MPASEYASFGGGALKLKGAKVKKHKKKNKDADLEKNLSTGGEPSTALEKPEEDTTEKKREKRSKSQDNQEEEPLPDMSMTEAERRLAEAKQKKVRS